MSYSALEELTNMDYGKDKYRSDVVWLHKCTLGRESI